MATSLRATNDPPAHPPNAFPPKTVINDQADTRDILSLFAGGGHTSLKDRSIRDAYVRLQQLVGTPAAQKLTNQAFLYNQQPGASKLTPEQRVQGFFSTPSADPEVSKHLTVGRGLGYGALDGFRNSPLVGNRILNGKDVTSATINAEAVDKAKMVARKKYY